VFCRNPSYHSTSFNIKDFRHSVDLSLHVDPQSANDRGEDLFNVYISSIKENDFKKYYFKQRTYGTNFEQINNGKQKFAIDYKQ